MGATTTSGLPEPTYSPNVSDDELELEQDYPADDDLFEDDETHQKTSWRIDFASLKPPSPSIATADFAQQPVVARYFHLSGPSVSPISSHGSGSNPNLDHLQDYIWGGDNLEHVESIENYLPGGYHPVAIGDVFVGTKKDYQISHKLGFGPSSTVWLCLELDTKKWRALKILRADISKKDGRPGQAALDISRRYSSEVLIENHIGAPLDHFEIMGPNGDHLCIVLPLLGPPVGDEYQERPDLAESLQQFRGVNKDIYKDVWFQISKGLKFLHDSGLCHGDLRPSNILLQYYGVEDMEESQLMSLVDEPFPLAVRTLGTHGSAPEYLVSVLDPHKLGQFLIPKVAIPGISNSYLDYGSSGYGHPPYDFAAPEAILDITNLTGKSSDIWALACTIFALHTDQGCSPFRQFKNADVFQEIERLLGPVPGPYRTVWNAMLGRRGSDALPGHNKSLEYRGKYLQFSASWQEGSFQIPGLDIVNAKQETAKSSSPDILQEGLCRRRRFTYPAVNTDREVGDNENPADDVGFPNRGDEFGDEDVITEESSYDETNVFSQTLQPKWSWRNLLPEVEGYFQTGPASWRPSPLRTKAGEMLSLEKFYRRNRAGTAQILTDVYGRTHEDYLMPYKENVILTSLLRLMLKYDPDERIEVDDVLQYEWFGDRFEADGLEIFGPLSAVEYDEEPVEVPIAVIKRPSLVRNRVSPQKKRKREPKVVKDTEPPRKLRRSARIAAMMGRYS